jgi:hypothetical protein
MGSKKNTGTEYELLVRDIFQAIVNQKQVTNVNVEHNLTLQGNTSPHQIDVYWKFEHIGITYENVIQAKDWGSRVKQEQLFAFNCVLDDLPGRPKGIFVTRTGYQKGAKKYADAHGIILYKLHEEPQQPPEPNLTVTTLGWVKAKAEIRRFEFPTGEDGSIQEELAIGIALTAFQPRYSNIKFEFNREWLAENPPAEKIGESGLFCAPKPLSQVILYDEHYTAITNLENVVREEIAVIRDEKLTNKHVVHPFEQSTFLGPDSTNIGYVKVNKVIFDIDIDTQYRPAHFRLKNFVRFLLQEISSGQTSAFVKSKILPPA